MNQAPEDENSQYLEYLSFKRKAIQELEETQLLRLESELAYFKEENRYMKDRLIKAIQTVSKKAI